MSKKNEAPMKTNGVRASCAMAPADHRSIEPPPRSQVFGTVLIITSVALLSIIPFSHRISPWVASLAALLAVAAFFAKEIQASHSLFFTLLLALAQMLPSSLHVWPFNLLIPLIIYFAVVISVPFLRNSLRWLRFGRIGKDIALLVVAIVILSGIALYLWNRLLKPDLSIHLGHMPVMPLWLFPFAGICFSLGNAAMEEFTFRGVIMQATDSAFGPGNASVIVQAWLFGVMHFVTGFPNGAWGLVMAFIYGIMLGAVRRRSQGLLAPWIAHVCADMVIFAILAEAILRR